MEHFRISVFTPHLKNIAGLIHPQKKTCTIPSTFLQSNDDLCNRSVSSFLPPACFLHDVMTLWVVVPGPGQLISRFSLFHSHNPPDYLLLFPLIRFRCPAADLHPSEPGYWTLDQLKTPITVLEFQSLHPFQKRNRTVRKNE